MAGLVGLAVVLLGLCSVSGGLWSLAAAPWGLALLGWGGLRGVTLWRQGRMERAVHTRAAQLQTLVHNSKTLTGLSRKALRLVQETEIDNVTNYVSAVPLKELGLGLGIEHLGDEQAQELTDDYSLPALKMLFQLWVGQSSECFRRMALLLSPRRIEDPEEGTPNGDTSPSPPPPPPPLHRSIVAVTEPLHHALASCLCEVQRSFDFHRHFETQLRTPTGSDKTGTVREKCRELNTLHTSIRSLQLHLKALLSDLYCQRSSSCPQNDHPGGRPGEADGVQGTDRVDSRGLPGPSHRLHHLQPHMQASSGCWEDTVCQVERMLRRVNACQGNAEGPEQCGPPVAEIPAPPPSYPLILDRDPVPEELEWEAYVTDSDSDGEGRSSWADILSPEEKERQRREREESRRVLSELKSVLGFRASEGERMKRKQMLFNDQAAVTPSARTESSGPVTEPADALGSVESGDEEEEEKNHFSECSAGSEGEEGEVGRATDGVQLWSGEGGGFGRGFSVHEREEEERPSCTNTTACWREGRATTGWTASWRRKSPLSPSWTG
ncbi:hypothetical protein F7725_021747 [Dissostichus mawsoni]|uniref:Vezatin n=1 Tax=Dissostichus mawsoni TaxID=36200 RepID=A0A7J5ZG71_DISMA|nr:hypothetical protein F7725_021747 [Dissostichus mawsoni]